MVRQGDIETFATEETGRTTLRTAAYLKFTRRQHLNLEGQIQA